MKQASPVSETYIIRYIFQVTFCIEDVT